MRKIYIGIDPGKTGAVASLNQDSKIHLLMNCPTIDIVKRGKRNTDFDFRAMDNMITNLCIPKNIEGYDIIFIIEKAQPFKKQGLVSTCSTCLGYGAWLGILGGFNAPIHIVAAKTWQTVMLRDMDRTNTKLASVNKANMLWPELNLKKTQHGRSDALLIAEYGRRTL